MGRFEFRFGMREIERGENLTGAAILRKRREYEAAHPTYPKWKSPEVHMAQVAKDRTHDLDGIIRDANEGRVGKDVTHMRLREHFERHHFDMKDTNDKGVPPSVEQQMEKWMAHHPMGKRAAAAVKNALPDTVEEKEAALNDLDHAHERQRSLAGGTPSERNENATKGADGKPLNKNAKFGEGAPLSPTNNPAYRELNRLAEKLVKRAKAEKGITMSQEQAFAFIANETARGQFLMKVDKLVRLGPSVA
jgi:hypothetical protein